MSLTCRNCCYLYLYRSLSLSLSPSLSLSLSLSPPGSAALSPSLLSRPMQRKLVTMVNCQLVEEEGRVRVVRAGRSLGERTVTELILQHQNPQQLSANLWAAVRARGCQFLGPGEPGARGGSDTLHYVMLYNINFLCYII